MVIYLFWGSVSVPLEEVGVSARPFAVADFFFFLLNAYTKLFQASQRDVGVSGF